MKLWLLLYSQNGLALVLSGIFSLAWSMVDQRIDAEERQDSPV